MTALAHVGPVVHSAHRVTKIEQAKGVMMLLYGVNSHTAYAVLLRWSRRSGADIDRLAHVLLHAICQNDPLTEVREAQLVRWMRTQL